MSRPLVEITGFDVLQQRIMNLADDRSKKNEMLKILRVVAQPTVKAAKNRVPVSRKPHVSSGQRTRQVIQPGSLKKSIGTITGKARNPTIAVGPRVKGAQIGFYGGWVDQGKNIYRSGFRRDRSGSASGRARNNASARSRTRGAFYMKQSYELTKGQVTSDAEQKVAAYIQRQIDRLSR